VADVEALIRKFHALQSAHDNEGMLNMYAEDGVRFAAGAQTRGRAALSAFYGRTRAGLRVDTRQLIRVLEAGPAVGVMEFAEEVTHIGPVPTPLGEIEGSNASFEIHGAAIFDFRGEQIARMATYSDGLFQMMARSKLRK